VSANTTASLVLTSKFNGLEPQNLFTCDGTIHGYLVLPETAVGVHTLGAIWVMPNGAINKDVKIPIQYAPPGRRTAYVWFQFDDRSDGLLGGVRGSPSRDIANNPFNGQWEVQVRWDDKLLTQQKFKVKC
jgi:hypothetical protein